jgi:hypothetical protein
MLGQGEFEIFPSPTQPVKGIRLRTAFLGKILGKTSILRSMEERAANAAALFESFPEFKRTRSRLETFSSSFF